MTANVSWIKFAERANDSLSNKFLLFRLPTCLGISWTHVATLGALSGGVASLLLSCPRAPKTHCGDHIDRFIQPLATQPADRNSLGQRKYSPRHAIFSLGKSVCLNHSEDGSCYSSRQLHRHDCRQPTNGCRKRHASTRTAPVRTQGSVHQLISLHLI